MNSGCFRHSLFRPHSAVFAGVAVLIFLDAMVAFPQNPRFPAPLGIDKVMTGVVAPCVTKYADPGQSNMKVKRDPRCAEDVQYLLVVGDTAYNLRGQEAEVAKYVGKSATVTGHVVGNDVTVSVVKAAPK